MPNKEIPSEVDIIENSIPDHLYSHDFGDGKYFQVVNVDESGFEIQLAPRTMFKVLYIKDREDIRSLELIKLTKTSENSEYNEIQKLTLSSFSFDQLTAFLEFISAIDLKGITEKRIQLSDNELGSIDEDSKRKIRTLLSKDDGIELIEELLQSGLVTKDIVNTGYRKQQLELFQKLLDKIYFDSYKSENFPERTKDEHIWQTFFENNPWIFGYGLDYRFLGILQKEFHASASDADGSGEVISDFLLADKKFTTFVEIKKPETNIFGNSQNRSNAWRLSNDLIDSVSQILEQKSSGILRFEQGNLHDSFGNLITQKPYDSKVILIIGNWSEINGETDRLRMIKEKTFELFRRDSRNIEILTFDELYDRAKHIVE